MITPAEPAAYIAAVIALYIDLPETPMRITVSDHALARRFFQTELPLPLVETALLLGSLRRLSRPPNAPSLSPIRSLAYFQPVIEELLANPVHESYLEYLRLKMRRASLPPANDQKPTVSDDR